ncbi:hypothetical protein E6C64_01965 [Naasia lichenicola]|uniref:DUF1906 domain-containing protein n=2 Tax=Naasia lichenicola TaxID=2565933 RepID=A0A4S4FUB5_9MICO|nr:hypothetical protein E6C64_01965 [Naasia lichenicola]
MRRWITRTLPVLVMGAVLSILAPQAAFAAKPVAPTTPTAVGIDVSWPQCGAALPTSAGFAIIGVNGGVANTWNPCLVDQLAWAKRVTPASSANAVGLYVNTANAAAQASWWPSSNTTKNGTAVVGNPYGSCTRAADYGPACTFVYGYSLAVEDVAQVRSLGIAAEAYRWWLDVETGNTWQSSRQANTAALEGMAVYLGTQVGASVGVYSTGAQWSTIAGTTPSTSALYALPSWLAGSSSEKDARARCGTAAPLTAGGRVAITQFVVRQLDYDIAC